MILPIIKIGDPILEKPCEEVDFTKLNKQLDGGSLLDGRNRKWLEVFIESMIETARAHDAVGLAANQVGESLRIFIIADHGKDLYTTEGYPQVCTGLDRNYEVCINPVVRPDLFCLTKTIGEGCLSIPHIWGAVPRPERVTIEYFNEKGEKRKRELNGLTARIAQHEEDHLNGILFIQRAIKIYYKK